MLCKDGEKTLKNFAENLTEKKTVKVAENIFYFQGYGHSNATLVVGDEGCVLIDCLDSDERGRALRKEAEALAGKKIKTVVYTHSHPDHNGGSGAFRDAERIIAGAPVSRPLRFSGKIAAELGRRGDRQFGRYLTEEQLIVQGLGPREGRYCGEGEYRILPPTERISGGPVRERIYGVDFEFIPAPGETDDTMYVWIKNGQALACGDNFYPCFPNLYALRGGRYRDVARWAESLGIIEKYPVRALLPGHGKAILTGREVTDTVSAYRKAIEYVLNETLDRISLGQGPEEAARGIKLPPELRSLPFLGEHYGCVEWSARSIYSGYVGWFDGKPSSIHPVLPKRRAEKIIKLAGGAGKLLREAEKAEKDGEYDWALEAREYLLDAGQKVPEASGIKKRCCVALARMETSACGRHFYLSRAEKL